MSTNGNMMKLFCADRSGVVSTRLMLNHFVLSDEVQPVDSSVHPWLLGRIIKRSRFAAIQKKKTSSTNHQKQAFYTIPLLNKPSTQPINMISNIPNQLPMMLDQSHDGEAHETQSIEPPMIACLGELDGPAHVGPLGSLPGADSAIRTRPKIPGTRCPTCALQSKEVWVIPGRCCGYCGTPCG
ncbi:hypothetical protein CCM_00031 [Cordyceps militaris CM01]|uniref:Uncharacterized protein n=1 Tax=Cordyceps militaris (strain CM01) TaxID=983644 RepID=G3J6P9_CORMM|nr:uncharacterized protein CCM_00031 [Cordyceps militaris CM01]EGX95377.1 hypothetical protein CCM_00031 [Cordyceps militaris CM01]